ncbi:putative hydro-lyase [Marinomonas gallaica]|uniref:putative hydro-lyase n=1 Tax=Marinomonas gallaica TaxID=1806667 RepID=UPI003CE5BC41
MSQSTFTTQSSAYALRQSIRRNAHIGSTSGLAEGFVQGNVVILPVEFANEFLTYCQLNPVSCPLIAVSEAGQHTMPTLGHDIDMRFDLPEYLMYENGSLIGSYQDIESFWRLDLVTFVLGCSFSFEHALTAEGLMPRNIEQGCNVSMFTTTLPTTTSGRFHGYTVVTMRPYTKANAKRAIQITKRFPKAHGAPIHIGDPSIIGIADLSQPDFGDPVLLKEDEVPVFWACGVTPQLAIKNAKPPICFTHAPGKMLVTDLLDSDLANL